MQRARADLLLTLDSDMRSETVMFFAFTFSVLSILLSRKGRRNKMDWILSSIVCFRPVTSPIPLQWLPAFSRYRDADAGTARKNFAKAQAYTHGSNFSSSCHHNRPRIVPDYKRPLTVVDSPP